MSSIQRNQELLVKTLIDSGAALVGFGDLSAVPAKFTKDFPVAISIAVELEKEIISNLDNDESSFRAHMIERKKVVKELLGLTKELLNEWDYDNEVTPMSVLIESNEQLSRLEMFSHKRAATLSGLGWIGKNSLFVSPQFGPRLLLGTVLTDAEFKTGKPVSESKCGDCSFCVSACPYGAIKGTNWKAGTEREKLADVYLCNTKRLEFIPKLGRKHACGLCIQSCPLG